MSKSKCTKHFSLGAFLEAVTSKKCTPLWREAHFQVKMYKTHHSQTTFGSWHVEKVHAVVARSTFRSQKHKKNLLVRSTFGRSGVVSRGRQQGLCTLSKMSKTWWFCSSFKNDGRRGTFEEDLDRCISRGRRNTRDTWVRCVRWSGRRFPERGCMLEHEVVSFVKMILLDKCSTFMTWHHFFSLQAQDFRDMDWKNRKTHWYEAVSSALNFPLLKDTNCFLFDVANFRNWGSLAELLRFWCCQLPKLRNLADLLRFWCCPVQKLRTSRRIASFSSLQKDR